MRIHDLTHLDRHALAASVRLRRDYFDKLRSRMDAKGWDREDEVYKRAVAACEAVQELLVEVTGRPLPPPSFKDHQPTGAGSSPA